MLVVTGWIRVRVAVMLVVIAVLTTSSSCLKLVLVGVVLDVVSSKC